MHLKVEFIFILFHLEFFATQKIFLMLEWRNINCFLATNKHVQNCIWYENNAKILTEPNN